MEPDRAAVAACAAAFTEATGQPVEPEPFCFGDSPEMADELLDLVRRGPKRATAAAVVEYEHEGEPLPRPGQHWVVTDGGGQPGCVVRTLEVRVGPLDATLDPAFAWDEGEGDRTREDWLDGHSRYWRRTLPAIGAEYHPDMQVVFERFAVVWPDADRPAVLAHASGIAVREVAHDERGWLATTVHERWGDTVSCGGQPVDPARLPGLVAVDADGRRLGLATFWPRPGVDTDLVTLDALVADRDVDQLLLEGLRALAQRAGWRRLRTATG